MKTIQIIKLLFLASALFALPGIYLLKAGDKSQNTKPIPEKYAKETELCLRIGNISEKDGYHTVNVHLINPTATPISFTGYSESWPWYKIQKLVDGKWVDHPVGWFCGTGLRRCIIPAGQSSVIPVHVKIDLLPVRVGVGYANGKKPKKEQQVVWSRKIEKK